MDAERIAANIGPLWPTANGILVELVEPGTIVGGFEVRDGMGVRKGRTFYVTRKIWDTLLSCMEIKDG